MNKIQVETAQNVQISHEVASLSHRIAAFLIDILLIAIYEIVIIFLFIYTEITDHVAEWALSIVLGLPFLMYNLLFEIFNNGQSIGKAALRLRVVRLDGTPPRLSNYLIRWLLRLLDIGATTGALAIFSYLLSGKGQRLGDIAAQTTVITERNLISLKNSLLVNLAKDYQPKFPQVTIFSDLQMQDIKRVFTEAKAKNDQEVLLSLAQKVSEILNLPPTEAPKRFIHQVITDYNYYTQQD